MDSKDKVGNTALHAAAFHGHKEAAGYLLKTASKACPLDSIFTAFIVHIIPASLCR